MADYKHTMKRQNGSGYDRLFPKTIAEQVIANDGKTAEQKFAGITSQIDDLTKKLIDPPVWQAPVYQNGWSSYVAHPLGYTKIRNVVYVLGLCVPPTNLASGQAIFTLPSGYWPKKSAYQVVAALNNAISQIFADASTGNVSIGITPGSMPSGWIPITLSFLTV